MAVACVNNNTMENWYCIYTKPRMEEHVSDRLMNLSDIEVFNPKLKRKGFNKGRYKEIIEELFPCYIFSRFNPERYHHLIKYTRGIRKIVSDQSGTLQIVDEEIIQAIKSRTKGGYISLEDPDLTFDTGEKVVVKEGVFKGLRGVFLKDLKARDRVLILLNAIAYQAKVEIEKGFLVIA